MRVVWAIAVKDLRLLMRDRVAAFFTLVFPLLFGVVFGLIFQQAFGGGGGGTPEIRVAIVDLDDSELSREYAEALVEMGGLTVVGVEGPSEVEEQVRRGRLAAGIIIPPGFGAGMQGALFGEAPGIEVVMDPSRAAEAGVLRGLMTGAGFRVMAGVFQRPDMVGDQIGRVREAVRQDASMRAMDRMLMGTLLDSADRLFGRGAAENGPAFGAGDRGGDGAGMDGFTPVRVSMRMPERGGGGMGGLNSAFELTYPQAAAWALVGCVTGFGLSLVGERTSGTLKRLAVAPVRRDVVVYGKALACFIAAVVVLAVLRGLFALPVFGVRGGAPWLEVVSIGMIAFAFVGVMMALSTVATSAGGAEGGVRAVLLILALLGGAGVPLMFFTGWLRWVTMGSPFRWAIVALEGSTWRGWTPGELLGPWMVLGGIGALGMVFGLWRFRRWPVQG
ncbi:MAG: ABC transporter permease [Phycisphaerales bacterium]|nr:ABC transporter permease [Planctomycetota bacterium]MCH8507504.1 ABC transporter permease [Phycisphaerales bacterium]